MEPDSGHFLNGFYSFYNTFQEVDFPDLKDSQGFNQSEVNSEQFYSDYFIVENSQENPVLLFNCESGEDKYNGIFSSEIPVPSSPHFAKSSSVKLEDLDFIYDDCHFDWEVNLDNLLVFPEQDKNNNSLPDLTPLCNDLCNNFVKESTEMLNIAAQNHDQNRSLEDLKPFQCSYGECEKIYAKAAHLKAHMRRHLGEKPYICTWSNCKWRFSRSDELARHRRSHSGVKPYKCDYCPKTFARSDHLAKHRKVHERKFATGKVKGVWRPLPKAKPGRKPKSLAKLQL